MVPSHYTCIKVDVVKRKEGIRSGAYTYLHIVKGA